MSKAEIKVYQNILSASEEWADKTRRLLAEHNIVMLNLIGSPGAGKTTLLEKLCVLLTGKIKFAVLEGDIETSRDADRLHALNIPVSQLISKGACHLGAQMIHKAVSDLDLADIDIIIVENVGNLVCPAEFDIGENAKIAVLSVTEGEDKPIKYPLLFREAAAVILTKTDLLPYLKFDIDLCEQFVKQVNSEIPIFRISSDDTNAFDILQEWVLNRK